MKQQNKVFVVGVGMTKFEKPGRREGWDYPAMVKEAGTKALEDAGVQYPEIEQAFIGNVYGDSCLATARSTSSATPVFRSITSTATARPVPPHCSWRPMPFAAASPMW